MRIDEHLKSLNPRIYMVGLNDFDIVEAPNPKEALRICPKAEAGSVVVSVRQIAQAGSAFSALEMNGASPAEIEPDPAKARRWLIHAADAGNEVKTILAMASSHEQIEWWAAAKGWDLLSAQSETTIQRLLDAACAATDRAKT
jgi:hypothetical protein